MAIQFGFCGWILFRFQLRN